ncbi:hypothetical protein Hdeb2414_s0007g00262021 [Helianthus debilis subsp. tardiflorus]
MVAGLSIMKHIAIHALVQILPIPLRKMFFSLSEVCKVAPIPGDTKVWQFITLSNRGWQQKPIC